MSQEKYDGPPDTHKSLLKQLPLAEPLLGQWHKRSGSFVPVTSSPALNPLICLPKMIASIPNLWAASKQPPPLITKSPAYHKNAIFFLQTWTRQKQGLHYKWCRLLSVLDHWPFLDLAFQGWSMLKKKNEVHVRLMTGFFVFKRASGISFQLWP